MTRTTTSRRTIAVLAGAALALTLAGCGADDQESGAAKDRASAAPSTPTAPSPGNTAASSGPRPPRHTPAAPPSAPTDQVGTGVVTGTAMAASTGPCVLIVTDEGEQFLLHTAKRVNVSKAQRVRAKISPPPAKNPCTGIGRRATATTLEPVG